jgi:hypothetical protein
MHYKNRHSQIIIIIIIFNNILLLLLFHYLPLFVLSVMSRRGAHLHFTDILHLCKGYSIFEYIMFSQVTYKVYVNKQNTIFAVILKVALDPCYGVELRIYQLSNALCKKIE